MDADIAIVNCYPEGTGFGEHRDNDEPDETLVSGAPVVSLNLGADCDFTFEKEGAHPHTQGVELSHVMHVIRVHSGDAIVFGGPARLALHSVEKVFPNTKHGLNIARVGTVKPEDGDTLRINITLRRHDPPEPKRAHIPSKANLTNKEVLAADKAAIKDDLVYKPNFLTTHTDPTVDELFNACATLPYPEGKKNMTRGGPRRHASVTYEDVPGKRAYQVGGQVFPLKDAPEAIQKLGAKLTAFAGKEINYWSVVRYRDGNDYMKMHQHKTDKDGREDMSVWIVSTGAERPFKYREGTSSPEGYFLPKPGGVIKKIIAEQGSLIVLPSSYNDAHGHEVPKCKKVKGVRYAVNCKHIPLVEETGGLPAKPKRKRAA
jgi:alkylated DNA repair dioxygenase AlkB